VRKATASLILVAAIGATLLSGCAAAQSGAQLGRLPSAVPSAVPSEVTSGFPGKVGGPCVSNVAATPGLSVSPDADLQKAEKIAMPEPQFWALISVLHGSNSDAAYARLTKRLELIPVDQIMGFEARMTIALYELDDQCRVRWYEKHDPSGLHYLADDDFLYVRADTVSAGEATWKRAIATDTLPWGSTDAVDSDGEPLLYVTMDAADKLGIGNDAWLDRISNTFSLSYETGSNPAGWPPDDN
jgi:hypothetical protein